MKPRDPYDWEAWAWDAIERAGDDMSGLAGLVLLLLAKHGSRDGVARPSARTLAGYLGRTDKPIRKALDVLVGLELIEGDKVHGRPTVWTLRAADPVSAPEYPPNADTGSAVVRTDCGRSADEVRTPVSDEGEGEGEGTSLSLPTEARDVGEGEVIDITKSLLAALSMDRTREATA